jgi:PBP1b-binding outer membrane lipoprotein LpoB
MKKTIIYSATLVALIFSACNNSSKKVEQTNSQEDSKAQPANASQTFNFDTTKLKTGESFYQCSMHAEVLSDKQGLCPKCEMDLSEMKKK